MVRLKHTPPQVELGAAVAPAGQVGGEGVARAADTISSSRDTLGQQAAIILDAQDARRGTLLWSGGRSKCWTFLSAT